MNKTSQKTPIIKSTPPVFMHFVRGLVAIAVVSSANLQAGELSGNVSLEGNYFPSIGVL